MTRQARTSFVLTLFTGLLPLVAGSAAQGQCTARETLKLTAGDAVPDAWYGRGIAISGDTVVAGATLGDVGRSGSGSAYVYRRDGNTWVEEAELAASDAALVAEPFPWFGVSAAVDGDVILIGAGYDSEAGYAAGAAYVYRFVAGQWTEEAKLIASDAGVGDNFGYAVSLSGDVALIGAYRADRGAQDDAGAAYVYRFNGAVWNEEAKLVAADGGAGDAFGWSVSLQGNTALIGAPCADSTAGGNTGAAYAYRFDGNDWDDETKVDPFGGGAFGYSVSLSADIAIIGSPQAGGSGYYPGQALVLRFDGNNWVPEGLLMGPGAGNGAQFGASVSVSGEVAVIGAWADSPSGAGSGSASVFRFVEAAWTYEARLTASDGSSDDGFGWPVAVSGDRAVIAAYHDHSGTEIHSAYLFAGLSDCNGNLALDLCDVAGGASLDCNVNGTPDGCEYPECPGILTADMNCDGTVNGGDIQRFLDDFLSGRYTCQSDTEPNGLLTSQDIEGLIILLLGG